MTAPAWQVATSSATMAGTTTEEPETMADQDKTDLLEELTAATCLRHLAAGNVGRIALVRDDKLEMFPVNYAMHDGAVIFRTHLGDSPTHLGGTLEDLGGGARVVFEIDELDHRYQTGWSVVVHGQAEHVTDAARLEELEALELAPWARGDRRDWVRIVPSEITGRRIRWS